MTMSKKERCHGPSLALGIPRHEDAQVVGSVPKYVAKINVLYRLAE